MDLNSRPSLESAEPTRISVSQGFTGWLDRLEFSFAFTSYQTGQLLLVGRDHEERVAVSQQRFQHAMGLAWDGERLFLASQTQIWRFENLLLEGETGDGGFDRILVPRRSFTTGNVDVHELGVGADGSPVFVATRFNCIATLDERFSFRVAWKPSFISTVAAGDRCHLNGLALRHGRLAYATAAAFSDEVDGWRVDRRTSGILMDVASGQIVGEGLSMPHSPRVHGRHVYLIDSGRGSLVKIDPVTGTRAAIGLLPGFGRGLSIVGTHHALMTVSKPRDDSFRDLEIDKRLATANTEPWCGVLLVDLDTGAIVAWLRLEGSMRELFDVVALPGVRCPMAIGPDTVEVGANVRIAR